MGVTPTPAPAIFPFEPDGGFSLVEKWTYFSDLIKGRTGAERRVPLVVLPRLNISWTVTAMDAGEAARLAALLWTESDNRWYVPRWTSARTFTKAGAVYTIDSTAVNFLDNSKAVVWRSSGQYDIMDLVSLVGADCTLSGAVTFDHTLPGTYLAPLMIGSITPDYEVDRSAMLVQRLEVSFAIDVAAWPQVPAASAPVQSYMGVELLTEVFSGSPLSEAWTMPTDLSGGQASSSFVLRPLETKNTGALRLHWVSASRAEYRDMKSFVVRRAGRVNPVWIAAAPEAEVAVAGVAGTNTLTLKDFDFGNYYTGDAARKDIVFLVGGILYPHRVTGWVVVGGGYRATLSTNLAVNVPGGTLVAFLRYCRFTTDTVEIETFPGVVGGQVNMEFTELPLEVP